MKTTINIIAAVGKNLELGCNNLLLCHLPTDLKRFKAITKGHSVIMGDRTWESLPFKPLPHRRNIVISLDTQYQAENAEVVHSIEAAIEAVQGEAEAFVIGGATIYRLFLEKADRMYLTHIESSFEADVYFPKFEENSWKLVNEEPPVEDNGYTTIYRTYER